ncbi:hypothetical protein J5N97_025410 [Dioscorea zingiberensis]|uniref:Trichome birefringence-like C-terminal domain-containing protein n=1 Tax=Dioscorea zingiberensis TaxID=325984 RepID=A0A9D5H9Z8_9LILI|nr:hypothetical protein J5N97_025410 [Dioscorea zingiberensis]
MVKVVNVAIQLSDGATADVEENGAYKTNVASQLANKINEVELGNEVAHNNTHKTNNMIPTADVACHMSLLNTDMAWHLGLSVPPTTNVACHMASTAYYQSEENNGASDASVLEAALQNGVEDSREGFQLIRVSLSAASQVEEPVEVYHDEEFKIRRWHFRSHNVTISVIWSPFLVKAENFRHELGVSSSEIEIHLDILDEK